MVEVVQSEKTFTQIFMMTFGLAVYHFHADRDRGPEPRSAEPTNILSQIEARAETEKNCPVRIRRWSRARTVQVFV